MWTPKAEEECSDVIKNLNVNFDIWKKWGESRPRSLMIWSGMSTNTRVCTIPPFGKRTTNSFRMWSRRAKDECNWQEISVECDRRGGEGPRWIDSAYFLNRPVWNTALSNLWNLRQLPIVNLQPGTPCCHLHLFVHRWHRKALEM